MEFYEVIESRRTTRDFENASIDDAIIKRIISAAMKAPSNDHMRDWHFIVIKGKDGVFKLIDKIPKQHRMFAEASCVVIPLFKQKTDLLHPDNLSHLSGFVSIWCSIANMLLATTAEGYAATLRIPLGNEGQWARTVL
ncbi:MAG: nitroreductase family protein, partial [Clostridiales bacterium]|nr:nitroreductase family protein [Clostridiales bacterium]